MINIKSSEQLNELFTALAKAQLEMPIVNKNKINPFFKSNYADITEMVKTTRPSLNKNGLSVIYPSGINVEQGAIMTCRLCHSSGQWIEGSMKVSPTKADIQSLGSYLSYLERYLYKTMTGCVTSDEDDDGEMAMAEERSYANGRGPVDKISIDQVEQLEYELQNHPDIKKDMMSKMNIKSISEIERNKYQACLDRIRTIKSNLNAASK